MNIPHHSVLAGRLTNLLDRGVSKSAAAARLNVTPSAVSQALATTQPATSEAADRAARLDDAYDRIEEALIHNLELTVPLMLKPDQISRVLDQVNRAKRRGTPATETPASAQTVVHLHLPVQIRNKFIVNTNNQVVSVGKQQLITMQSANIQKLAEAAHEEEDEFGFPTKRQG